MKKILTAVFFISICVRAGVVQFGGLVTDSPYAGATSVVEWNGVYTNLTNGSGSSGNGTFSGLGADANLTCPGVGLVMTAEQVTQDDGISPGTMNAGTRIGIDGGRSSSINPYESIVLSFNVDVELKAFDFQAITSLDLYEISWNSTAVTNSSDYTFAAGNVLNAGATLTLRGLVSGGDLADSRTDSFNFQSLTVESVSSITSPPPPVVTNLAMTVTDRAGTNMTGTLLVDSDHIHVEVASPTNITSFSYQYVIQPSEPTTGEWAAMAERPFFEDMWFYREPINQWVRILAADVSGASIGEVVGLQGGVLTAPPDDPITPAEWLQGMRFGGARNSNVDNPDYDVKSEGNAIVKKKHGLMGSRIHMDMEAFRIGDAVRIAAEEKRIKMQLRHGFYITIAAQGDIPALSDPAPGTDGKPMDTYSHVMEHTEYTPEMQTLFSNAWSSVAEVYKNYSHRTTFAYFIELRNGANKDTLEAMYTHVTPIIRAITPTRIQDYVGKSRNEPAAFPVMDLYVPGFGSPYYMYSFHKGFGGANPSWYWSQQDRNLSFIQPGIDYRVANPTSDIFMDVYNHTQDLSLWAHRIKHVKSMYDALSSPANPITSICSGFFDSNDAADWQYDLAGNLRSNSYYTHIAYEILNGAFSSDPNDRDGDTLTNDEEAALGTDPDWADTDGDSMFDHQEVQYGFDPLDPRDGINPWLGKYGGDADGDGILNAWEVQYADLDPFTPNDGLVDHDGDTIISIFETWARTEIDNSRNIASNEDDDRDGDGILDSVEWAAGTNPLDNEDIDFDGLLDNEGDDRPFISDLENVIRYDFDSAATDTSRYGANNSGTLQGAASVSNGVLYLGTGDSATIPETDLVMGEAHSVYLRFNAVNLPHDYQVIYSEGDSANGLAIFLYENEAWAGCWVDGDSDYLRLGTAIPGKWHRAALTYDGGEGGTLTPWLIGYFDGLRASGTPLVPTYANLNSRASAALGAGASLPLIHSGLGGSELVFGKGFAGRIDDVNIFNRVLADIDVSLLGGQLYRFDSDTDGVIDLEDAFPQDIEETLDADGDGAGNNADPDDDNDGISDANEIFYGLDPLDPSDAGKDADKDGMSNGDEIFAGTNPADSNSVFAISELDPVAAPTRLQWMSVSGRTYFVEYSSDLASWQVLPGAEGVVASGVETGVVDTNETVNVRFYRAGVIPE